MKTLKIVLLLFALVALPALAQVQGLAITTGITAGALADTLTTATINMQAGKVTNQLSLSLAVTPGTTTVVDVTCYESVDGSTGWDQLVLCDNASPSACVPDIRRYTLANYTAVSGVKWLASRWPITKKFARCSADDPNDGDGTVTVTGWRTWR